MCLKFVERSGRRPSESMRARTVDAICMSRRTALQKINGKVRGVAAGSTVRCLVGKVLAKQFQAEFRSALAPANFGLCDGSGTDAFAHLLRAASQANPGIAITFADGVGVSSWPPL